MRIIVLAKQVMDPDVPQASFHIDEARNQAIPPAGVPPVLNGFDEQAVEAALRLKSSHQATITVITLGKDLVNDVIKKPLSMGADELVVVDDDSPEGRDAYATASLLALAVKKAGAFDLILCGRQASDTDRGQVGVGVAELLGLPAITIAKGVEIVDGKVRVERVLVDGIEVVEVPLPALVTVSNELGEPRYPTLRGIMQAGRKQPTVWSMADIGAEPGLVSGGRDRVRMTRLYVPKVEKTCEFIEGESGEDIGRKLALRLREVKLI